MAASPRLRPLRTCYIVLCISAVMEASSSAAAPAPAQAPPGKAYPELLPCSDSLSDAQLAALVQRFAHLLTFRTVSSSNTSVLRPEWSRMDAWLRSSYADVFSALDVEMLGAGSMTYLLSWRGSQPGLDPVLFLAHTDVVPAPPETLQRWTHPPFSGAVADGFVWGRGAMDVKLLVLLQLEAVRALLARGYQPARTLLFSWGQDEEIGGRQGAAMVARALRARGVTLHSIVDEGPPMAMDGLPPFYASPVALVATAEKRVVGVQVTLRSKGGHASMPPIAGAGIAAQLGRFLTAMQQRPPPLRVVQPTTDFISHLGLLAPAGASHLLRASGLLPPLRWLLARLLSRARPETAAMVRTTVAVTRVTAGTADNVLPQSATVGINVRLLPGDSPHTAVELVRGWLGRDAAAADVALVQPPDEAPLMPVADARGAAFAVLAAAIQRHWKLRQPGNPSIPVVPLLMPAVTDSRHYLSLCTGGALRFSPWTARRSTDDLSRLHGVDERMRVSDVACALATCRDAVAGLGQLAADAAAADAPRSSQGASAGEL